MNGKILHAINITVLQGGLVALKKIVKSLKKVLILLARNNKTKRGSQSHTYEFLFVVSLYLDFEEQEKKTCRSV